MTRDPTMTQLRTLAAVLLGLLPVPGLSQPTSPPPPAPVIAVEVREC